VGRGDQNKKILFNVYKSTKNKIIEAS
jgi:hypothetical protein